MKVLHDKLGQIRKEGRMKKLLLSISEILLFNIAIEKGNQFSYNRGCTVYLEGLKKGNGRQRWRTWLLISSDC
jgi:hypothetical protein